MSEQTKLDLSKPVQTRDGRPVRVLCTDRKGADHPIMGLVLVYNTESLMSWPLDGRLLSERLHDSDLINVPPRKVKRDGWVNINRAGGPHSDWTTGIFHTEQAARAAADSVVYIATIRIEWEEDEQP